MIGNAILLTDPPDSETIRCLKTNAQKCGVLIPHLFWGQHKDFGIDTVVWTDEGCPDWIVNPKEYVNDAWR